MASKAVLKAFLVTAPLWAAEAQADDVVLAMQLRLLEEDFYEGEVDGVGGPATRAGFAAYAEKHSIEADQDTVMKHMINAAFDRRMEPTEKMLAAATAKVKDELLDPYSADIRIDATYILPKGYALVCGEVNAKNALGAYVGFQWFNVALTPVSGDYSAMSGTLNEVWNQEIMCIFGTGIISSASSAGRD